MWVCLNSLLISLLLLCPSRYPAGERWQEGTNSTPGKAGTEQQLRAAPTFKLPNLQSHQVKSSDLQVSMNSRRKSSSTRIRRPASAMSVSRIYEVFTVDIRP